MLLKTTTSLILLAPLFASYALAGGGEVVKITAGQGTPEKRHEAARRIVATSAALADKAGHNGFPEAQQVWFDTMASAYLGEPVAPEGGGEASRVLETPAINAAHPPAGGRPVILVPVFAEDRNLLWVRRWLDQGTSFARYMPGFHVILIRLDQPVSDEALALAVMHEAWHAREWVTREYDWQNPQVFAEEERRTHEFQGALASMAWGQAYVDLVAREAAALATRGTRAVFFSPSGKWQTRTIGRSSNYRDALDPILGKPKSDLESDFVATGIWIEATFAAIGEDPIPRNVFLQAHYQTHGLAPDDGSITTKKSEVPALPAK